MAAVPSRPTKRARTHPLASTSAPQLQSKREGLFAPFRSLGHVSTGVPFVVQSKSSKFLETPAMTVVTSLGRSWAMWDGQSLRLLFVGECSLQAAWGEVEAHGASCDALLEGGGAEKLGRGSWSGWEEQQAGTRSLARYLPCGPLLEPELRLPTVQSARFKEAL